LFARRNFFGDVVYSDAVAYFEGELTKDNKFFCFRISTYPNLFDKGSMTTEKTAAHQAPEHD
jgi:hypothetical protein